MRKAILALGLLALISAVWVSFAAAQPPMGPLAVKVQAVASKGAAAPGNNANANVLVLVTDLATGAAVTNLTQADFAIVDHFDLPGQSCGFSGDITSFNNVMTGAYQFTIATRAARPPAGGCKWVSGEYLGQVIVKGTAEGQAAFTLTIP